MTQSVDKDVPLQEQNPDNRTKNRQTGDAGEEYVAQQLQAEGYTILVRNFAAPPVGEIDIIAKKTPYLAFVEVKTRVEDGMLPPMLAVTKSKQDKIVKTALLYLQKTKQLKQSEEPLEPGRLQNRLQPRFDIAEVTVLPQNPTQITGYRHWKNVFWPGKQYRFF